MDHRSFSHDLDVRLLTVSPRKETRSSTRFGSETRRRGGKECNITNSTVMVGEKPFDPLDKSYYEWPRDVPVSQISDESDAEPFDYLLGEVTHTSDQRTPKIIVQPVQYDILHYTVVGFATIDGFTESPKSPLASVDSVCEIEPLYKSTDAYTKGDITEQTGFLPFLNPSVIAPRQCKYKQQYALNAMMIFYHTT